MSFTQHFIQRSIEALQALDPEPVERAAAVLRAAREKGGRLFLIGSGGGAGHASHATCDFRKLAGFEAYCPLDNVSELSARINDDGWDRSLADMLAGSRIRGGDCLMVFSVGGGSEEKKISTNLVEAMKAAKAAGASVVAVVGRDGGYAARVADACVIVPTVDPGLVTPITESFQALVWHLWVSHPDLQTSGAKWESTR